MTQPAAMQATHACTPKLVKVTNLPDVSDTYYACIMGEQPLQITISTSALQRADMCIARSHT